MNSIRPSHGSLRAPVNCVVDSLESRRLLCGIHMNEVIAPPTWDPAMERRATSDGNGSGDAVTIQWTNRGVTTGATNDYFTDTFGVNAPAARSVVDQVLADWSRAITDWNRSDGSTTLQVTISMLATGTGFGAGAGPSSSSVPADGKPRTGSMTIGRGNDTNADGKGDGSGWFIDSTPASSSEYLGGAALNAFSGYSNSGSFDFYTIVNLELTHVLGLISGTGFNGYKLATSGYTTTTTSPDVAEAGASNTGTRGFYATFNGPTISHLMTTNNAGSGGSNWGSPIHTAGSAANVTINGVNYRGSEDSGNAVYDSARYLPSEVLLRMLGDAYGYSIKDPKTLPNLFAQVDSSGLLTVRGMTGSGSSADTIDITESGGKIIVSVDIGNDVPGSGALPGAGNLTAYISEFDASAVTSIVINAGDGADNIRVATAESITVNGGSGSDTIRIERTGAATTVNGDDDNDNIYVGLNNSLDPIDGALSVIGGNGSDTLWFEDLFNNLITPYTINASSLVRPGMTTVNWNTASLEGVRLSSGSAGSTFYVRSTLVPTTINAGDGSDSFYIGNTSNTLEDIDASVTVAGEANSTDLVQFYDTGLSLPPVYQITSNTLTRGGIATVTFNTVESFILSASGATDEFHVASTGSGVTYRIFGGANSDRLYIGDGPSSNRLDPIDGQIIFDGESGSGDTAFFWDTNETSAGTFTVGSTVARSGMATPTLTSVENIEIDGGTGSDRFDVTPSTVIEFYINGRSGTQDTLNVITTGTTNPVNTPGATGSGAWTFGDRKRIDYVNIESVITNGTQPNQPPTISSLTPSPSTVAPSGTFTLTAQGVSDPDGSILGVQFFRENNGIAGFQSDDLLLTTDTNPASGWTANIVASTTVGTYTYYARAIDNSSAFSNSVQASVTVQAVANQPPSIVSLVDFPDQHLATDPFTLIANGVSDPDDGVFVVRFYVEFNGIPGLQATNPGGQADLPLGPDSNGTDGWSNTITLSSFAPGTYTYYAQAQDFAGALSNVVSETNTIIVNPNTPRVTYGTTLLESDPLRVLFLLNADVSASLDTADLVVRNRATNATVSVASFFWDPAGTGVIFSLAGVPADGNYRATLQRSGVSAGGVQLEADFSVDFFILRGDANRDRTVNFADLVILAQNYNQTGKGFGQGNFNYSTDGKVDFADLVMLAQRYNTSLPLPVGAMTVAKPASLTRTRRPDGEGDGIALL